MKLFSSFNSGGSYETVGFGYGPGIGEDFDRLILILSRASGRPVVAGAIQYAAVKALWKEKIFAGSGMGCTGPVILVAAEDHDRALEILNRSGYL